MEELTNKQLKTRWADIRKQINERQLLAYRVGIPIERWDDYMHSTPSMSEINRIYAAIQDDRKTKTLRIREGLTKIVGYREAKEFSRKTGVSDTSIRDIIEGKKEMAGYDMINKLEILLNSVLDDFELSVENPLTIKTYSREYLGEIAVDINRVADDLRRYCFKLSEMARNQELEKDWYGNAIPASESIKYSIQSLTELKSKVDIFWETYIVRNSG